LANIQGTQTLERGVAILRLLGEAGTGGLRLIDVQQRMDLPRPTAHRIMLALERLGLVLRDADAPYAYHLGPELAVLGWLVHAPRYDLLELCQRELIELADETGDTAYLIVRSAYDAVCVDLKLGRYPVKAIAADVGARWPLGIGAGSIAILAHLEDDEQRSVLAVNQERLKTYAKWSAAETRRAVRQARESQYAFSNEMVLNQVAGLAVPVVQAGVPIAALCLAGIGTRIVKARLPELLISLTRARRGLEAKLARPVIGRVPAAASRAPR